MPIKVCNVKSVEVGRFLATWIPAQRALSIDPAILLPEV